MPEALLFIKPTLTECKEHFSSPNYGKIWNPRPPPLPLPVITEILYTVRSIAVAVQVLLKVCFTFLINSVSLLYVTRNRDI